MMRTILDKPCCRWLVREVVMLAVFILLALLFGHWLG